MIVFIDIFVNIYSLILFVLPLNKLIKFEKELKNGDSSGSIKIIVQKVLIYSIIMIAMNLFLCLAIILITAINSISQSVHSIIAPMIIFTDCYCVIMQFDDINLDNIKSQCLKRIIIVIQCNRCCIKLYDKNSNVTNNKQHIELSVVKEIKSLSSVSL